MTGRSSPETISTKLLRIAALAREDPKRILTTLAHHIDAEWLQEAYRLVRKDGATGVDGQTAKGYEVDLQANLESLLERLKTGTYRAPPVRRTYIPKADGKTTRPIGVPTLEDKVLQKAVAMVLEAVYEQDFLDCSYGFRPSRSAHDALARTGSGSLKPYGNSLFPSRGLPTLSIAQRSHDLRNRMLELGTSGSVGGPGGFRPGPPGTQIKTTILHGRVEWALFDAVK